MNDFKREMAARFRMSDLGALSYYLGIEVRQGKEELSLGQSAYTSKLLERSAMAECKPCVTPMEERLKLTKASTAAKVDATLYRSIVGGLRYLVHTRPDICVRRGLRQSLHGGSLGCGEAATTLCKGDGESWDHLPKDWWE